MSSAPDTRPLADADGLDPDQDVEDGEDDHNVEGGDDNAEDGDDDHNVVADASFYVISGPSLPACLVPNQMLDDRGLNRVIQHSI